MKGCRDYWYSLIVPKKLSQQRLYVIIEYVLIGHTRWILQTNVLTSRVSTLLERLDPSLQEAGRHVDPSQTECLQLGDLLHQVIELRGVLELAHPALYMLRRVTSHHRQAGFMVPDVESPFLPLPMGVGQIILNTRPSS